MKSALKNHCSESVKTSQNQSRNVYHHFPDKYAVLEEVEEEIYANFAQVLNDHVGWAVTEKIDVYGRMHVERFFKEACLVVMNFLYERKETAQTLLGEHGRPHFIEKLEEAYISAVQKKIRLNPHEFTELEKLQQEFIYHGAIAIVKRWIRMCEESQRKSLK